MKILIKWIIIMLLTLSMISSATNGKYFSLLVLGGFVIFVFSYTKEEI